MSGGEYPNSASLAGFVCSVEPTNKDDLRSVRWALAMLNPLILLVDDYADGLDLYRTYLTITGHRVITAANGTEAIAAARAERPALVFMDLVMPDMSGIDAMRAIRADPGCHITAIVALTAHVTPEGRREALDSGFDGFIPKPCLPDALASAADRWLDVDAPEPARPIPQPGRAP